MSVEVWVSYDSEKEFHFKSEAKTGFKLHKKQQTNLLSEKLGFESSGQKMSLQTTTEENNWILKSWNLFVIVSISN